MYLVISSSHNTQGHKNNNKPESSEGMVGLEECILPQKKFDYHCKATLIWLLSNTPYAETRRLIQLWTSLAKCDAQGSLEIHHCILCGMQASILHFANPRIVSFIACKTTRVKGQMQIVSRLARFVCVCKPGFAKLTVDYSEDQ